MKYSYPTKFNNNNKAAYIRGNIMNGGALYIFYRNSPGEQPCEISPPYNEVGEDILLCGPNEFGCLIDSIGFKNVMTDSLFWHGWGGNTGQYRFFAYFVSGTPPVCPPGWNGITDSTQARVKTPQIKKKIMHLTYKEVPWTCDFPLGCEIDVQAPDFFYVGDDIETIDFVDLNLKLPSTINEAEGVWDSLSEDKAGPFPLSGANYKYFYAFGAIDVTTIPECRSGGTGHTLDNGVKPWAAGNVESDTDTGGRTNHYIDTEDVHVEVKQTVGGWQDTGMWSGNSIYETIFNSGYWSSHVIDLDA